MFRWPPRTKQASRLLPLIGLSIRGIQEILETPVHTIAGLGVKARAAQNACAGYWYDEASNLDWDARAARSLIEAALAVAGRDFVYLEPERNEAPENKISDDPNSPESVASRTKIRAERIRELPGELVHTDPPGLPRRLRGYRCAQGLGG